MARQLRPRGPRGECREQTEDSNRRRRHRDRAGGTCRRGAERRPEVLQRDGGGEAGRPHQSDPPDDPRHQARQAQAPGLGRAGWSRRGRRRGRRCSGAYGSATTGTSSSGSSSGSSSSYSSPVTTSTSGSASAPTSTGSGSSPVVTHQRLEQRRQHGFRRRQEDAGQHPHQRLSRWQRGLRWRQRSPVVTHTSGASAGSGSSGSGSPVTTATSGGGGGGGGEVEHESHGGGDD